MKLRRHYRLLSSAHRCRCLPRHWIAAMVNLESSSFSLGDFRDVLHNTRAANQSINQVNLNSQHIIKTSIYMNFKRSLVLFHLLNLYTFLYLKFFYLNIWCLRLQCSPWDISTKHNLLGWPQANTKESNKNISYTNTIFSIYWCYSMILHDVWAEN